MKTTGGWPSVLWGLGLWTEKVYNGDGDSEGDSDGDSDRDAVGDSDCVGNRGAVGNSGDGDRGGGDNDGGGDVEVLEITRVATTIVVAMSQLEQHLTEA